MKEYKEMVEEFCLKHQPRWFDTRGDHNPSYHAVFALTQKVSDRINGLLETVEIYKNDVPHIAKRKIEGRIKELEKEIEEMAVSIDTSKDPYFDREFKEGEIEDKSGLEIERDGKKIIISKVKYNQAEQDFGYCVAINQPQIDFWNWYLEKEFKQLERANKKGQRANEIEAIKEPFKKDEPQQMKEIEAPDEKENPPINEVVKVSNEKEKKSDLNFIDYFRGNEERMNVFFDALLSMGAINKEFEWIYEGAANTIVACFDALENIKDEHGITLAKWKHTEYGKKKRLFDLVKQEITTPIKLENFRKWQFDYEVRKKFKKKLEKAFEPKRN